MVGHAGGAGWDEILFVVVPLLIFTVAIVLLERRGRIKRAERERDNQADNQGSSDAPG